MTTRDAPRAEPAAAQRAVTVHRLERVLRARWMKTAVRAEPGANNDLVAADQEVGKLAHTLMSLGQSFCRLSRNCALVAVRTAARVPTTISNDGNDCCARRKDSRISRRTRLRSTALPATRAATARPRRAPSDSLRRAFIVKKASDAILRPRPYTASKSALRRMRRSGGKPRGRSADTATTACFTE